MASIFHVSLTLILITFSVLSCNRVGTLHRNPSLTAAEFPSSAKDVPQESTELQVSLRNLRSTDRNERENAKSAIINLSNRSVDSRRHVIQELLRLVRAPNGVAEFAKSYERFLEWSEVTDTLATLKSTEAIGPLVECLDCTNGGSGLSPDRFPATKAIIKIGDAAIPSLAVALRQRSGGTRLMAAQALYAIGGEESRKALVEALRRNRDKQTAPVIKYMLRNWARSGGR